MSYYRIVLSEGQHDDLISTTTCSSVRGPRCAHWSAMMPVWSGRSPSPSCSQHSGRCVNLTDLHRRLLTDVFAVGGAYPLVRTGLEQHGWHVRALETDRLSARLIVTDPISREECEVDILKEALWRPPVHTEHGLVLSPA